MTDITITHRDDLPNNAECIEYAHKVSALYFKFTDACGDTSVQTIVAATASLLASALTDAPNEIVASTLQGIQTMINTYREIDRREATMQ